MKKPEKENPMVKKLKPLSITQTLVSAGDDRAFDYRRARAVADASPKMFDLLRSLTGIARVMDGGMEVDYGELLNLMRRVDKLVDKLEPWMEGYHA